MAVHPLAECLDPLKGEPGHHRRHDQAGGDAGEGDLLLEAGVIDDDDPSQGRVVPVEELGRRVNDDVGPQLERPLEIGGEERVVRHVENPGPGADLRDCPEVGELQGRVCRSLGEDHAGGRPYGRSDRLGIRCIDEGDVDTEPGEELVGESVGAPVDDVPDDHMVTSPEQGEEHGDRGCHPGAVGGRIHPSLQGDHLLLEGADGGVPGPAVGKALGHVGIDRLLDECGRLVDRGEDGSCGRIGLNAGVYLLGAKSHVVPSRTGSRPSARL